MSDISVIGLGSMGAALARTLQRAGHQITVWNRTPEKMQPFVTNGGTGASCVAAAVQASPAILVCIDNYATTRRILGTDDVVAHLAGRVGEPLRHRGPASHAGGLGSLPLTGLANLVPITSPQALTGRGVFCVTQRQRQRGSQRRPRPARQWGAVSLENRQSCTSSDYWG